jgi:hypothetical protein
MAGFPLMAIGAGIGQGVQAIQQQRAQAIQMALQQLALQQAQQQQQNQQQTAAAYVDALEGMADQPPLTTPTLAPPALPSPTAGTAPSAPLPISGPSMYGPSGSAPGSATTPTPPPAPDGSLTPGAGSQGGSFTPGSFFPSGNGTFADALARRFQAIGLPPAAAQGAAAYMQRNESGNNPLAVNPSSGALGRAQWLGPRKAALLAAYGPTPTDDQQAAFITRELLGPERRVYDALKTAASPKQAYDEWGAGFERPGSAALAKAGVGAGSSIPAGGAGGGSAPAGAGGGGGISAGADGMPAPDMGPLNAAMQHYQQTVAAASQSIDSYVNGRMSLPALMKLVDKTSPNATPLVKMMAVQALSLSLAPQQKMQWDALVMQNSNAIDAAKTELQEADQNYRAQMTDERMLTMLGLRQQGQGWQVMTDPTNNQQYRFQPSTGQAFDFQGQPYTPGGAQRIGTGTQKAAKNITVTDPQGKTVFSGAATQTLQGWVDSSGNPVPQGNVEIQGAQRQPDQLPPEVKFPDKWAGMPNSPPPGVRQDVWDATLFYARTHQMPQMGFQAGGRDLIFAAYPAALHALGIPAASAADMAALYAGERHGEIVGGGRAAQIGFGLQEAAGLAPQVIETSRAVPRGQFPGINRFWNWLQEQGGSPQVVAFRDALNSYLNVYAATVSRTGRLTDSQQKHAYELLSTSFNQGQIEAGIAQLNREMQIMQQAVNPTMQAIEGLGQPPAMQSQGATAPAGGGQPATQGTQPGAATKYKVGQVIDIPGKGKYRVTGGDLNGNPDIEPMQ